MFDITQYNIKSDYVILRIEKNDLSSIITKKVRTNSGGIITFDFDTYIDAQTNEFKLAREIAQVIAVGTECTLCKIGDDAIMDYSVEDDYDNILYEDHIEKVFFLKEKNVIQKESHGVWNTLGNYSLVWAAGDMTEPSLIYGVIRNERIICNENYIIFTYEDAENLFELTQSGIYIPKIKKGDVVTLTIEFAPESSVYKPGDNVCLYDFATFTKSINCNAFLMGYEMDVLASLN